MDSNWRKSTYSGGEGGNCVEVGTACGEVLVRDTTNRDGGTLLVHDHAWRAFAHGIKTGTVAP